MNCKGIEVYGPVIDDETRCTHYHSVKDIIAIKFYCCKNYFPCVECHKEDGCGKYAVWPMKEFHEKAILCGSCGSELSIDEYLNCQSTCPQCEAAFNPGCSLHKHFYFEV
ncbi:CHY zinc finger protein [Jeotgalibacillus soli]|uniref:Zinc finger domain containing protein n=1 Tax=Jeotgalibacillus soli TaxID=889306 RepID=A0A0C2W680_9BACL|nr:CHY zinc finger protein [Jeotgalibacillus soli]KIL52076.1 zinc finger domain containing protein [Jeotgalibacillus soli]